MKKISTVLQKPGRVAAGSLIVAAVIGAVGYWHFRPSAQNAEAGAASTTTTIVSSDATPDHLTLGFLASGRIKTVNFAVGDSVTKGTVIAELDAQSAAGALTQAGAAYESARANYQKLLNGATDVAIKNAQAAVNTAQTSLDQIKKQQDVLVANAYRNLLNSSFVAEPTEQSTLYTSLKAPTISGSYTLGKEGTLKLDVYASNAGQSISISGLGQNDVTRVNTVSPEPIGNTGLYIQFPGGDTSAYTGSSWKIEIPNKLTSNYTSNYNAYQLALQARDQASATAQATLDQAKAALDVVVANPRSEDMAVAKAQLDNAYGALQMAQGSYSNTVITAPADGTITAIHISVGQIVTASAPAVEMKIK